MKIGGKYNWRNQPERLAYMGTKHYGGDRRTWHQFEKVDKPGVVWSEVLEADLSSFEETVQPCGGCGETQAEKRCIGCMHQFTAPEGQS